MQNIHCKWKAIGTNQKQLPIKKKKVPVLWIFPHVLFGREIVCLNCWHLLCPGQSESDKTKEGFLPHPSLIAKYLKNIDDLE